MNSDDATAASNGVHAGWNDDGFRDLGTLEDMCPYCHGDLPRRPRARSQCPACGEWIYVKMRPLDRKRVLATEDERDAINDEWATVYPEERRVVDAALEKVILKTALEIINTADRSEIEVLLQRIYDGLWTLQETAHEIEDDGSTTVLHRSYTSLAEFLYYQVRDDEALRHDVSSLVVHLDAHGVPDTLLRLVYYWFDEKPSARPDAKPDDDDLTYPGALWLLHALTLSGTGTDLDDQSQTADDSVDEARQILHALIARSESETIQNRLAIELLIQDPDAALVQSWRYVRAGALSQARDILGRCTSSCELSADQLDMWASQNRLVWILERPDRASDLWWQESEVKADAPAAARRARIMVRLSGELRALDPRHAATGMLGFALERLGENDEAHRIMVEAIEQGSEDPLTYDRVSLAMVREKRFEDAQSILRSLLDGTTPRAPRRLHSTLVKRLHRTDMHLGAPPESPPLHFARSGGSVVVMWDSNIGPGIEPVAVSDGLVTALVDERPVGFDAANGSKIREHSPVLGSASSRLRSWVAGSDGWSIAISRSPYSGKGMRFRLVVLDENMVVAGETLLTAASADVMAVQAGRKWALGYGSGKASVAFLARDGSMVGEATVWAAPVRALGALDDDAVIVTPSGISRHADDGSVIWRDEFKLEDKCRSASVGPQSVAALLQSGTVVVVNADGGSTQMPFTPSGNIPFMASAGAATHVLVQSDRLDAFDASGHLWTATFPGKRDWWANGVVLTDGGIAVWGSESIVHLSHEGLITHDFDPLGSIHGVVADGTDLLVGAGSRLVRFRLFDV